MGERSINLLGLRVCSAPLHRTRLVGAVDQFLLSRNRKNASIEDGVSAGKLKSGLQREVDAILDHSVDAYNLETLQSDQIHQHFEYNLRRIINWHELQIRY